MQSKTLTLAIKIKKRRYLLKKGIEIAPITSLHPPGMNDAFRGGGVSGLTTQAPVKARGRDLGSQPQCDSNSSTH